MVPSGLEQEAVPAPVSGVISTPSEMLPGSQETEAPREAALRQRGRSPKPLTSRSGDWRGRQQQQQQQELVSPPSAPGQPQQNARVGGACRILRRGKTFSWKSWFSPPLLGGPRS